MFLGWRKVMSWPSALSLTTIGCRRKRRVWGHLEKGRLDNIVEPSEDGRGGRLGQHRERTWKVQEVRGLGGPLPSAAQSTVPCQGTLRHVIDLHAQAPIFFLPLPPTFTLCILVNSGPTALLNHRISHCPSRTSQRKGRQMCIDRAAMPRAWVGYPVWVFDSTIEA